jgi:hypothetical protein
MKLIKCLYAHVIPFETFSIECGAGGGWKKTIGLII